MRTEVETSRAAQARQLQDALVLRLAKGREWATPGIEAALRRMLTGIDSGLEAASPRLQASLRMIADELAGGVEAATPRLHEGITRLIPEAAFPARAVPPVKPVRKAWLVAAVAAATITAGVGLWQAMRSPEKESANERTGAPQPARAEQVDINQLS
ncbi:hypothetical protein [Arthrobacter globiformis]|uniref:hypothetical protein n=1 Tax=Arthrobacter globiformis TaxID=1665 RepID=UPI000B40CB34|nr:hypothetical protein [Arthrobacter globiformis]